MEVFKEESENNKQANTEGESLFWDICSSALASKFLLLNQNTDVLSQEDTWQMIHYVKSGIRGLVQNSKLDCEHGLCVYWRDPDINSEDESVRKQSSVMKLTGTEGSLGCQAVRARRVIQPWVNLFVHYLRHRADLLSLQFSPSSCPSSETVCVWRKMDDLDYSVPEITELAVQDNGVREPEKEGKCKAHLWRT